MITKTRKSIKVSTLSCAIALILSSSIANAIVITNTIDANELANNLIIDGSGITITDANLYGGITGGNIPENDTGFGDGVPGFTTDGDNFIPLPELTIDAEQVEPIVQADPTGQAGTFTNTSGVYGLPSQGGIVLSTGFVENYEDGPNTGSLFEGEGGGEVEGGGEGEGGGGTPATDEQNTIFSEISGQELHFDPVELEIIFDVDDDVEIISFIAAFGSEEYPEYVSSSFTDAFGMFLNNELVAGVLPSDAVPGDDLLPVNINHPDFAPITGTELNGMLAPNGIPLLRFDIPVEPGSTGNVFSIMIADASDSFLDTTVFLSSFGNFDSESGLSEFTPILPDPNNPTNDDGAFVFDLPELAAEQTIWLDPDVATGYVYDSNGAFASITAPTLLTVNDSDGYLVDWYDSNGILNTLTLSPGQTINFGLGVTTFTLYDINPDLGLDPLDNAAFSLGVSFQAQGTYSVTQAAITTFVAAPLVTPPFGVPEPSSILIFGLSILGFGLKKRSKKF
jgi:hypothetical protein